MTGNAMTGRISRLTLVRRALAVTLALEMARRLNPPAAGATGGSEVRLQLLSINDFRGGIEDRTVSSRPAGGAAALAAHLALRRAGRAHSLTVHAGDLIGASPPISALARDEPSITSMDLLGVQLGSVGNHGQRREWVRERAVGAVIRTRDGTVVKLPSAGEPPRKGVLLWDAGRGAGNQSEAASGGAVVPTPRGSCAAVGAALRCRQGAR
jgi:hypothetical protein